MLKKKDQNMHGIIKINERNLVGLDLLIFLLSIRILVVHFPLFSFPYLKIADKNFLPFESILKLLCDYGALAVEIFWMTSWIIFYHFYLISIENRKISFFKLMYCRVSKLYPLHFFTLLSLAYLQYSYTSKFGQSFIYGNIIKPARELVRVLAPGGTIYLGTPIGNERVCFDAHRLFNVQTVLYAFAKRKLTGFSLIDHKVDRIIKNAYTT
jgi:SAM-dependent methyltransferase